MSSPMNDFVNRAVLCEERSIGQAGLSRHLRRVIHERQVQDELPFAARRISW